MQRAYERGMKQINMIDIASITCEKANKQKKGQTSKQVNKKGVSEREKYRFRSSVHSFIVLKHGRHTSKQDSCMEM